MPKLLWVLLPLLAVATLLALRAWWRRPPSRHALNMVFSLLLLAYVSATAALGIFWVANQQLPVFDWHYLFGYATVLLVSVHLVFNFRQVWQFLRRRRPLDPEPERAPSVGRRPLLGAIGAVGLFSSLAAAGIGYLAGLRHGRTELHVGPAAAGAASPAGASAAAGALVERFHEFSAHSRRGVLRRAPNVEWGDPPPPFKSYAGAARLALPPLSALPGPARPATAPGLDAAALGALLWHTSGVSERRGTLHLRTSPSSGALFATELYLVVRAVDGVAPGLWHYDVRAHALEHLQAGAVAAAALGIERLALPPDAAALVVASAVFRRSGHKYGDRTYRYVLADLGHALENLRVAAAALGTEALLLRRFDEGRIGALLALDAAEEGVLALALLRPQGAGTADAPQASVTRAPGRASAPSPASITTWRPAGLTLDGAGAVLGVTEAMQRATSLRAIALPRHAPAAVEPGPAASSPASPAAQGAGHRALPPPRPLPADWLGLIAARRSRRRFAARPLGLQELATVLAAMAGPPPVLSDAVRVDVLSSSVLGLEPAAWRFDAASHSLQLRVRHASGLRQRARAAALDQDVIGDAAAVIVLSLSRQALAADTTGPARGYRHGFLEAGLVGERLYLAAGALGLGACAVGAFYDDEAAALVGTDPATEWVVHFAALGTLA